MEKLENLFKEFDDINSIIKLEKLKTKIDDELMKLPGYTPKKKKLWEETYQYHRRQVQNGINKMSLNIPTVYEYFGIINDPR